MFHPGRLRPRFFWAMLQLGWPCWEALVTRTQSQSSPTPDLAVLQIANYLRVATSGNIACGKPGQHRLLCRSSLALLLVIAKSQHGHTRPIHSVLGWFLCLFIEPTSHSRQLSLI